MLPIVIVGAGPAGLTTALRLLAQAPALADRVLVLEKARFPRDKICAGGLGERGLRVLRDLDALPEVPCVPIHGFCMLSSQPRQAVRREGCIGLVIRRLELDAALAALAQERGVRLRQGVKVTGLQELSDRVRLETSDGQLEAAVVVGADGVGSLVRRHLDRELPGLRAQVVEVDTQAVEGDEARDLITFDIRDHDLLGYSWHFATLVDGEPRMCRGVYHLRPTAHEGLEPVGTDIEALLAALLTERGLDPAAHRFKRFAERCYQRGARLVQGRLLLVGEAAGIDPVSGEGLAHGIEYGDLAGRFLARTELEPAALAGWQRSLERSRLGWDLALCHRLLRHLYGPRRERTEAMLFAQEHALKGCVHRFAGELPGLGLALRAALWAGRVRWGG